MCYYMFASDTTTHKTPPTNPLRTFFGFLLKVLLRVYVVVFVSLGFFKSFFKGFVSLFRCFVDYCITCFICRCVVVSYISFHMSFFVLLYVWKQHIATQMMQTTHETPQRQIQRTTHERTTSNNNPPTHHPKPNVFWGLFVSMFFGGCLLHFVQDYVVVFTLFRCFVCKHI